MSRIFGRRFFWELRFFFKANFCLLRKKEAFPPPWVSCYFRPVGWGGWKPPQVDPYIHRINDTARRHFAGMVSALDEGIGNVTNALEEPGEGNACPFFYRKKWRKTGGSWN